MICPDGYPDLMSFIFSLKWGIIVATEAWLHEHSPIIRSTVMHLYQNLFTLLIFVYVSNRLRFKIFLWRNYSIVLHNFLQYYTFFHYKNSYRDILEWKLDFFSPDKKLWKPTNMKCNGVRARKVCITYIAAPINVFQATASHHWWWEGKKRVLCTRNHTMDD